MARSSTSLPRGWPLKSDWTKVLRATLQFDWFEALQQFVAEERERHVVYPPAEDMFQAFRLTAFAETKVVILGQDPYHGPHQAHGLSFSVRKGVALPPSLRNIFRELVADLGVESPSQGDLSPWAKQGVLLLNTVLTVRAGDANSHAHRGWERFTDEVIRQLGSEIHQPSVFVLWGKPALQKKKLIHSRHLCLVAPHPSPLSARRGFFGSRPFSRINTFLKKTNRSPIDWELP
jgi:uracil-DNA glycosylase